MRLLFICIDTSKLNNIRIIVNQPKQQWYHYEQLECKEGFIEAHDELIRKKEYTITAKDIHKFNYTDKDKKREYLHFNITSQS